jgi:DNA invertase Pin-like site-specific DNA recombinase
MSITQSCTYPGGCRLKDRFGDNFCHSREMENLASSNSAAAYIRCSTIEQEQSGAGLAAQRSAITAELDRRGLVPVWVVDASVSGAVAPDKRPGLGSVLPRLDGGELKMLMVSRLDRLGRSLSDVAALLDRADKFGWAVVTVDTAGMDMSTPSGRLLAGVLASAAAFERDLARQRTREGLAARRAQGVRLGRPPVLDAAVIALIQQYRDGGHSLRRIAGLLDEQGVPTAHGARLWHPQTVANILRAHGSNLPVDSAAVSA